jgi:hypothetical protein
MPGIITKHDQIPGPLGLASASLEGKVALVTGAGRLLTFLSFRAGLSTALGLY